MLGLQTSSFEPDHPTGQALCPLWVLILEADRMSGLSSVRRQASWQHRSKVNANLASRVAPTLFVNCRHVRGVKIKLRASGALLSRTATNLRTRAHACPHTTTKVRPAVADDALDELEFHWGSASPPPLHGTPRAAPTEPGRIA